METKRISLNTNIGFLPMSEFLKEKPGVRYYQKPILCILIEKRVGNHNNLYIILNTGASIAFEYGFDQIITKNPYKELGSFFQGFHPKNFTSYVGYNFAVYRNKDDTNALLNMDFIRKVIHNPESYPNLIRTNPYEIFQPSKYTEICFSVSEEIDKYTITSELGTFFRLNYHKHVNFYSPDFQENIITSFGNRLYCYTKSILVTTAQERFLKCPIRGEKDASADKFIMPLHGYTFAMVYAHSILPTDEEVTDEMVKALMDKSNEEKFSLLYWSSRNFVESHEDEHFFSGNPIAGFIWNEDFILKDYFTIDLEPSESKPPMVYTREDQKKLVERVMKLYNGEERVIPIYLDVETTWNGEYRYHYTLTPDNELQDKE